MSVATAPKTYKKPDVEAVNRFCGAAMAGDNDIISQYLSEYGPNIIDQKDPNGRTALLCATYMQHEETVVLLLQNNAAMEIRDNDGDTALNNAVGNRKNAITVRLIKYGANVNAMGEDNITPLITAAIFNQGDDVSLLLERGADVHVRRESNGDTALMCAARNACSVRFHLYRKAILLLLKHGAGINDKNAKGETPLMLAARNGYTEAVALLLECNALYDTRDNAGKTALDHARDGGFDTTAAVLEEHTHREEEKLEEKREEQREQGLKVQHTEYSQRLKAFQTPGFRLRRMS